MNNFISAVQFLTRIPVLNKKAAPDLSKLALYFPIVGLLLGAILVAVNLLGSIYFSPLLSAVITVLALVLLTGAFHLDGFADTIDGFYAGETKEERLRIMKDHQVGAMGIVALICLLGLKVAALNDIPVTNIFVALLLMPLVGRWMMVLAAAISTSAREGKGLGAAFTERVGIRDFCLASILPASLIIYLLGLKGIGLILIAVLITTGIVMYSKSKIGGMTGDTLGFVNEIVEIIVLLSLIG